MQGQQNLMKGMPWVPFRCRMDMDSTIQRGRLDKPPLTTAGFYTPCQYEASESPQNLTTATPRKIVTLRNGMKKSYDLLQFGCSASRAGHDVELGLPVLTYGMEWSSASGAEGCKARRGAVTSGPNDPRGCIKPRLRIQGSPRCLSNDLT